MLQVTTATVLMDAEGSFCKVTIFTDRFTTKIWFPSCQYYRKVKYHAHSSALVNYKYHLTYPAVLHFLAYWDPCRCKNSVETLFIGHGNTTLALLFTFIISHHLCMWNYMPYARSVKLKSPIKSLYIIHILCINSWMPHGRMCKI